MNIYSLIQEQAGRFPDKTLIAVEHEAVTYAHFVADVEQIAAALAAQGVTAHQKIALILPNDVLWYEIYWAIVKLGALPVPLDPQSGEWEMVRLLTLADIRICFVAPVYRQNMILENLLHGREHLPNLTTIVVTGLKITPAGVLRFEDFKLSAAEQPVSAATYDATPDDALMLACTSGSTGNPKVIVVPHEGFYQSQLDMATYLGFTERDIMLLGMPLYHQGGFGMGLQMLLKGGTVYYQPTFEPVRFLELVAQKKVTALQLTATLAKIILSVPDFDSYDLSSLRICYFAGEVLPMEVAREFYEHLGIRVINIIGSSETATMIVWDSDFDRTADVNEFRPLSFTAMRILNEQGQEVAPGEVGTLFIHTAALIQEYYGNERETAARIFIKDGKKWFNTGDLGKRLADGRMRFMGRAKRIIKRGANLLYPEEIESFLLTHPQLAAVAVVGEPHELMGEETVAYIQPQPGNNLTRGDIVRFCHGKLANYKIPDRIVITATIPHAIGKVQFKYLNKKANGEKHE